MTVEHIFAGINLTSTVFSRFCAIAREKFFAFNKEFARIENSDE